MVTMTEDKEKKYKLEIKQEKFNEMIHMDIVEFEPFPEVDFGCLYYESESPFKKMNKND